MKPISISKYQLRVDARPIETKVTVLEYSGIKKTCKINCSEHGEQEGVNARHLLVSKYCCPKHGRAVGRESFSTFNKTISRKYTDEEYIKIFNEIHNNRYTYDMTRDEKSRITLHCPIHGESKLLPSRIPHEKAGCKGCNVIKDPIKKQKVLNKLDILAGRRLKTR